MLTDGGHGQTGRQQIQSTDTLLEGWVQGGLADVAAMRHTGDLAELSGPPHQPPQRRTWDALLGCNARVGCPAQHPLHGPESPVKVLPLWRRQRGGIQRRTRQQPARTACDGGARRSVWCREERVWEGSRPQRRRIRWEQGQGKGAIERELLQIDQQVSLRRAVAHDLPDRRFYQMRRKRVFKTARHLADRSDVSPQPHLTQGGGNVSKNRKRLAPGMQEDQVVVALSGESPFSPNPEDAPL